MILKKNNEILIINKHKQLNDIFPLVSPLMIFLFRSFNVQLDDFECILILLYILPNNKNRNDGLKKKPIDILENINSTKIVILGDFNGHIGFLEIQSFDYNGNIVLEIMERYYLILDYGPKLLLAAKMESRDSESVTNFIINQNMYCDFENMKIDKEEFDLSDHNMNKCKF